MNGNAVLIPRKGAPRRIERDPYTGKMAAIGDEAGMMTADPSSSVTDITKWQESTDSKHGPDPRDPQALTFDEFNRFCREVQIQPLWRREADKCCDYYDNNQLDAETLQEMERRGLMPIVKNLIQPTIDVVLGMEAKTRTDWRVIGDTDREQDTAEGLSQKLHEAERESRADRSCSDAYASMVKAGIGWVEVSRAWDPFDYPYFTDTPHRREMYWDWVGRPDLSNSRYLIRRRWFDVEAVATFFPEKAQLIRSVGNGLDSNYWIERGLEDAGLSWAFDQEVRTTLEDYEWRNTESHRMVLFEVWYRRYVNGYVLKMQNGNVVELDMQNQNHVMALATGKAKPIKATYTKLRKSIWAGPHRLRDAEHSGRHLPYVPFWGYREDLTGIPYGLIRTMISPQDELNARAQKMLWLLSAKRVTMSSGALDTKFNTLKEMLQEIGRADAVVVLANEFRKDKDIFEISENLQLAEAQFKVMMENMETLQKVKGIFNAMMGSEKGATAGVAISALIEQSTTVLAEINDNQVFSRRVVGERLLELVSADLMGQPVEVLVEESGSRRRTIILNEPVKDAQGNPIVKNDVSATKFKVGLSDIPSTPAYRAQMMTMLGEVMKGMPPEIQGILAPFWIEATELPKRRDMADLIRKHLGIQDEKDLTPEQQAELKAAQQAAQALKQRMDEALVAEQENKAAQTAAQADKVTAETEKLRAELQQLQMDAESGMSEQVRQIQEQAAEVARVAQERAAKAEMAMRDRSAEIAQKHKTEIEKANIEKDKAVQIARMQQEMQAEQQRATDELQAIRDEVKGEIQKLADKLKQEKVKEQEKAVQKGAKEQEGSLAKVADAVAKGNEQAAQKLQSTLEKVVEAMTSSQQTVADALGGVQAALSKPRKVRLEMDDEGNPTGAVSGGEEEGDELKEAMAQLAAVSKAIAKLTKGGSK